MKGPELVIAGGGLTAARAIKSYREAGDEGRITLVSEEATLPYHRPSLSKKYLRGETTSTPHVEDAAFYREHRVDVHLETRVTGLDAAGRAIELNGGDRLRYDRLLLATGAAPRRLRVPGSDLESVYTLRTVGDSAAIRKAAAAAERAAVVGGGFIGMEVAASLRQLGLEVTLIHVGRALFDQLGSPELSAELRVLYREQGVELLLEQEVTRFGGTHGLAYVETADGLRLAADLAVVGVGVTPNVDFLAGSGLALENGVAVDARFETNAAGIYAAGDAASFFDPLYGRRRRIEHWSNANYQGTQVGRVLAGRDGGYDTVSSFFTEVFGTTIKVFGDVSGLEALSSEGSLAEGFLATYGSGGRLAGALTVGQDEAMEALVKRLIQERAPADALEHELVGGPR